MYVCLSQVAKRVRLFGSSSQACMFVCLRYLSVYVCMSLVAKHVCMYVCMSQVAKHVCMYVSGNIHTYMLKPNHLKHYQKIAN